MQKKWKRLLVAALAVALTFAAGLSALAAAAPPAAGDMQRPAQSGAPAGDETAGDEGSVPGEDTSGGDVPGEDTPGMPEETPGPPPGGGEAPSGTEESPGGAEEEAQNPGGADGAGTPQAVPEGASPETGDGDTAGLQHTEAAAAEGDSITVTTYEELKKALGEDNGYTTIYLGANIAADGTGVSIHPGKLAVVIDGTPPGGERHTLVQYRSAATASLLRVDGASPATTEVVLRNLDVDGGNHYGVVWVRDGVKTVTLSFENVNYTGPQPAHHTNGTVRFIGGSYTLAPVGGMEAGELAEALYAELGGALTVKAPNTTHAILWLASASSTLTVLEGADVAVDTGAYFLYGGIAGVALRAGAVFSLTSRQFGFSYAGHTVGSFTMYEGSGLYINLHTRESYAALRVAARFEMKPGSSATIIRTGTDGIPLRLTSPGAQAVFDGPRRVFFYSSAGVPLRFTGGGTLSIITSAVNVWAKTAWPLAGGEAALPTHIWNKAGEAPIEITASYYETANRGLAHNLNAGDPVLSALDAGNFNLEGSQLLAFGAHALAINTPTDKSDALTGSTLAGAALLAEYTVAEGPGGTAAGTADAAGRYSLPLAGRPPVAGSRVSVVAQAAGLAMRQWVTAQDASQYRLAFTEVPGRISFGTPEVPGAPRLVERQQAGLAISVLDSRLSPSAWRIDASLEGAMAASIGGRMYRLPGGVIFKTEDGQTLQLSETPQTVYRQNGAAGGEFTAAWGSGEGLLLGVAPGEVYAGAEYNATVHWALVDAP